MVCFFFFWVLDPSTLGVLKFLNSISFLTIFSAPDAPIGRVQILFVHQKQWSPHFGSSLPWVLKCSIIGWFTLLYIRTGYLIFWHPWLYIRIKHLIFWEPVLSTLRTALISRNGSVQFLITAQHWLKVKLFSICTKMHGLKILWRWRSTPQQQGVYHTVALPFTLKSTYLKAKEELGKLKYFTKQNYT